MRLEHDEYQLQQNEAFMRSEVNRGLEWKGRNIELKEEQMRRSVLDKRDWVKL